MKILRVNKLMLECATSPNKPQSKSSGNSACRPIMPQIKRHDFERCYIMAFVSVPCSRLHKRDRNNGLMTRTTENGRRKLWERQSRMSLK
jgi:hypothetical protein